MHLTTEYMQTTLEQLGYKLNDRGDEWRAKPVYRDSGNENALRIFKNSGRWQDFARGYSGDFFDLIRRSGGEVLKGIATNQEPPPEKKQQIIPQDIKDEFAGNEADLLQRDHSYWEGRGISKATMDLFRGGILPQGTMSSMYGRYVFPIFNTRMKCLGYSGRWINPDLGGNAKWKHLGQKKNWVYPGFINKYDIASLKKVILVESIGDGLKLWDCGIKNFFVLFGLEISDSILNALLAIDCQKIIVSTNNDGRAGNSAAWKISKKLSNFFDTNQIETILPESKDWGEASSSEIKRKLSKIYE